MSRSSSRTKLAASSRTNLKGSKSKRKENSADEPGEGVVEPVAQLAWTVLSEGVVQELSVLTDVEDVAKKLAHVLSLTQHDVSLQEAALLDYYVAGYWFAKEMKFTSEQTSAFFTVLHTFMENLKEKEYSLTDSLKELQQLMSNVGGGSGSAQSSLQCFSSETAVATVQYMQSTIFQHYHLFQLLFSEQQQEEKLNEELQIEVPPDPLLLCPPPLEEAIPLELYQRCLLPKSAEHSTEEVSTDAQTMAGDVEDSTKMGTDNEALLLSISAEELASVMDTVASSALKSFQDGVQQKIKQKEESFMSRITKLEKNSN